MNKKRFECPHCNILLSSKVNLEAHINNHHTKNPIRYHCEICSKIYKSRGALQQHKNIHHIKHKNEEVEPEIISSPALINFEIYHLHRLLRSGEPGSYKDYLERQGLTKQHELLKKGIFK
jgi:uncharacterized Zn-finger protein